MAAMDIEMASPVGPLVAPGYGQGHEFEISAYQPEIDLCQLLQAMSLTKGKFKKAPREGRGGSCPVCIAKGKRARCKHAGPSAPCKFSATFFDASASSSSKSSSSEQAPCTGPLPTSSLTPTAHPFRQPPGCHYLQSILASLAPESPALSPSPYPYPDADAFQTTNGAYLDALHLHRALIAAYPPDHKGCGAVLLEIASAVELRAWQADRDSDAEAADALRQEAHFIAAWV